MNAKQLEDRLTQAGAIDIVNRGYAVDAAVPQQAGGWKRKVRLRFLADKAAPAGWWWTFEVGEVLGEGRPLANASEVDGAVQCWAKDATKAARMDRRDASARRRRQTHEDAIDAVHYGLTFGSGLPVVKRGDVRPQLRSSPLALMLGIVNEVAGTNALRQLVEDQDLPTSLLAGLPERRGPGRHDAFTPRIPIDADALEAFREEIRAGTVQVETVRPTSMAHLAFLEAKGRCSISCRNTAVIDDHADAQDAYRHAVKWFGAVLPDHRVLGTHDLVGIDAAERGSIRSNATGADDLGSAVADAPAEPGDDR